ncbi:MAG: 3'(2'),5'-bisphosphate nucleotidase CysQ [Pseudomonadota bacterium]
MSELATLCDALGPVARRAGEAIMAVYAKGFSAQTKHDGSPVTEADKAAEAIILDALVTIAPEIPVVSEENPASHMLEAPETFFLVDPLDGTKEFLKPDGKGAFTVNIALIQDRMPVMGIVFAPALGRMFTGCKGIGAFHNGLPVHVSAKGARAPIAVASASHRDQKTDEWLLSRGIKNTVSIGSSLKFGLVAAGEADVYPRFGPTMEWDTAAGDAVLRAAGGSVSHPDGSVFDYGKAGYRNGPFLAQASPDDILQTGFME